MSLKGKKVFTRKPVTGTLYKWSPDTNSIDKKSKRVVFEFCDATPYSINGDDSTTKYVTNLETVDGKLIHNAYVECNYVS